VGIELLPTNKNNDDFMQLFHATISCNYFMHRFHALLNELCHFNFTPIPERPTTILRSLYTGWTQDFVVNKGAAQGFILNMDRSETIGTSVQILSLSYTHKTRIK